MKDSDKWIPEIYYEENKEGLSGGFPFIKVPKDKSMPSMLFICESRDISHLEEEELETELVMHSYGNMLLLRQNLDKNTYNKVRKALGLNKVEVKTKSE